METNEKLNAGIGNLEAEKLSEGTVKVLGVKIEEVKSQEKVIGEKVVFIVKHSDREDSLQLSKVKYIKNEKVESSGTWYNLDAEDNIVKASALASTMRHYGFNNLNEFIGKDVQTILDGSYLAIKAY